jgi:hypothetical protein
MWLAKLERNLPPPAIDPEHCPIGYIGAIDVDYAPAPPDDEIPRCGRHVIREIMTIVGPADAGGHS